MDISSYLDSNAIRKMCLDGINAMDGDISDNDDVLQKLHDFADSTELKGEAFTALKNQMIDYDIVVQLCESADEADKTDFWNLYGYADETLDGSFICPQYDSAIQTMEDYQSKARTEWLKAAGFDCVVWLTNPVTGLLYSIIVENPFEKQAKQYEGFADVYERIANVWKAKIDKYDNIYASSASLFLTGKGYRDSAKSILEAMDKQSLTGTYGNIVAIDSLRKEGNAEIIGFIFENEDILETCIASDPEMQEYFDNLRQIEAKQRALGHIPTSVEKVYRDQIDELTKRNDELLNSLLGNMSNKDEIMAAIDIANQMNLDEEEYQLLLAYWFTAGDLQGFENNVFPPSIAEGIETENNIIRWKYEGNPEAAKAEFDEDYSKYLIIKGLLSGEDLSTEEKQQAYLDNIWKQLEEETQEKIQNKYDTEDYISAFEEIGRILGGVDYGTLGKNLLFLIGTGEWKLLDLLAKSNNKYSKFAPLTSFIAQTAENNNAKNWTEYGNYLLTYLHTLPGTDAKNAYDILAILTSKYMGLDEQTIKDHYEKNLKAWEDYVNKTSGWTAVYNDDRNYIERQGLMNEFYYGIVIQPFTDIFMSGEFDGDNLKGSGNMCEIIGTYNTLTHLGEEVSFADIVKDFEGNAPILGGNFGSSPSQYKEYIESYGYETTVYSVDDMEYVPGQNDDYQKMLDECDAVMISVWCSDDPFSPMHTMAITINKTVAPDGTVLYEIVRHNDYTNNDGTDGYTVKVDKDGLHDLINGLKTGNDYNEGNTGGPLMVLGIKDK